MNIKKKNYLMSGFDIRIVYFNKLKCFISKKSTKHFFIRITNGIFGYIDLLMIFTSLKNKNFSSEIYIHSILEQMFYFYLK